MFRCASRLARLLLLTLVISLLAPAAAWAEAFVIDQYHVDVQVEDDTRILISETIDVNFTEPRRGIFRDIPLRFAGLPIRIESIRVDGQPIQVETSRQMASIRIGDPDVTLTGPVSYRIHYTLIAGGSFSGEPSLFYLNLIGHDWDTTIRAVSFDIRMPHPFEADQPNVTAGPVGSESSEAVIWEVDANRITGQTTRTLNPKEGVTVYMELPAGYYSGYQEPLRFLPWLIPGFSLGLLAMAALLWNSKGKDNRLVVTPEFYAPDGMTPPEAGYILHRSVSPLDMTSLIIYWASKGYLTLEQLDRKNFKLIRKNELPPTERHFESYFFNALFTGQQRNEVLTKDLEGKFHDQMTTAQGLVSTYFTDHGERRIYEKGSIALSVLGSFISLWPLWLLASYTIFRQNSFHWDLSVTLFGLLVGLISFLGITLFNSALLRISILHRKTTVLTMIFALLLAVGGLVLLLFLAAGQNLTVIFFPVVASAWLINLLGQATTKRTAYGDRMLGQTLGFRRFLRTAEKERIERLLEDNPAYFYDILPYAQVLRVTKKWTKKFQNLTIEPPSWYRGYQGQSTFNAYLFAMTLNRSMGTVSRGIAHNPQKNSGGSGFGGGGFSGGGAGGGGGGSW